MVMSVSANSKDDKATDENIIVFDILDESSVSINGVNTKLKRSWQEAMDHIIPDRNNYYQIINKNKYSTQASSIKKNMDIVAKISGVKIKLIK